MARKPTHNFESLTTGEAEKIVQELGRVLDAHRDWIDKFRTMLVCRSKPKAADLSPESHKKTEFGRWYFGSDHPELKDHPNFAAVGKKCEKMHAAARKLAEIVRDGGDIKPAQYNAFVKSNDTFQTSVRKLLSEAWDFLRLADPLTGVMTRAAMKSRLEAEQERARRTGQVCCVGIMDLDHFKKVNDTHGHQAGDEVLKAIAGFAKEHLRRYDQVFRYGGEEFVLVLPNTSAANAKNVLDRLRRGIKRQKIEIAQAAKGKKAKTLQVSASFGVAELHPEAPIKDSIEAADKALYTAKETGRNRVCVG